MSLKCIPLVNPTFKIIKLGYTWVYLFLLFLLQNRLWLLVRTVAKAFLTCTHKCFVQIDIKNIIFLSTEIFNFYSWKKISVYWMGKFS